MRIEYAAADPLGLALIWNGAKLSELGLVWFKDISGELAPASPEGAALQQALQTYVQGREPRWPALPLDFERFSPFARNVLLLLKDNIAFGEKTSYGRLAAMAGNPRAARAVGRVMAMNPYPLVVPCHRVVGSTGRLTGFSGSGIPMKRFLLELEGGKAK
jgi:methylated-DNA-[protein]-cysteine S-methyltransferase